jgi:hypothetical protein
VASLFMGRRRRHSRPLGFRTSLISASSLVKC